MDTKNTLRVHSIETFGTLDGPGIRFVVFLQGCPLKCLYCHNRDTWDTNLGNVTEVNDLVSEIKRYIPYMKSSGGGVTVSGGEPLLQAKIVTSLFKELHKLNIHTCIDTAGSLPINDDITNLLKVTDLVLLDIKHIDDEKSKVLTGLSNKNNLDFAKFLSDNNIPVWIRQVILPRIYKWRKWFIKIKRFCWISFKCRKNRVIALSWFGQIQMERTWIWI